MKRSFLFSLGGLIAEDRLKRWSMADRKIGSFMREPPGKQATLRDKAREITSSAGEATDRRPPE